LLAAAAEPMPEPPLHSLTSEGVVLILGATPRRSSRHPAGAASRVTVMLSDLRMSRRRTRPFPVVQAACARRAAISARSR